LDGIEISIPFHTTSISSTTYHVIELGLFTNPLISNSDLLLSHDNYDYEPEIINNIDRFKGTDHWFCKNCTMKQDKWFMMEHPCKNNKNKFNQKEIQEL
jgi:hypothetical protein